MELANPKVSPTLRVASAAILAGVTTVLTFFAHVPIPRTTGYVHLGDTAVVFAALTLGPFTAAIAGGLGTAVADLLSGVPLWAPISLVVHGLQGLVVGLIGRVRPGSTAVGIVAGVAGGLVMIGGYFLGGLPLEGLAPTVTAVLWNVGQAVAGVLLGIPLSIAVRRAYPPVRDLAW